MRTTKPLSPRHQVHEASIHPTGLELGRRSSDVGSEQLICCTRRRKVLSPASTSTSTQGKQLICYTRRRKFLSPASPTTSTQGHQLICYTRRRKVLSRASATTSTQLALNDNEDNEDTGSNKDVRRGPVYGYFPGDVSFAAIHEHRNRKGGESSWSPKRVGELSPFITKRRRRDVAPPVTTSVETANNCIKKPALQRQTEPTNVPPQPKTYYSEDEHRTNIDVKKSGESDPSSRSPRRVGNLSPPIRKSKRRRDVAPPVTTTIETGTKPRPQPVEVPSVWNPEGDEEDVPIPAVHEHLTNSKNVEKSGESLKRVGELIRKKKRTRRDVAPPPVTTNVETESKAAPQRPRERSWTDVEFEWGTYYPEVMKMSWGPWSRSRKEVPRSMQPKKKKKTRKVSTALREDIAQIIERTFADSRIVRCPNPCCEYHFRAIHNHSQAL